MNHHAFLMILQKNIAYCAKIRPEKNSMIPFVLDASAILICPSFLSLLFEIVLSRAHCLVLIGEKNRLEWRSQRRIGLWRCRYAHSRENRGWCF